MATAATTTTTAATAAAAEDLPAACMESAHTCLAKARAAAAASSSTSSVVNVVESTVWHMLLSRFKSSNNKNDNNQQPQQQQRTLEFFKLLLDHESSVDVNRMDDIDGKTLLHHACLLDNNDNDNNNEECCSLIQFLIQHGAHVNQRDRQGRTPLWTAAVVENNLQAVQLLVQHGAWVDCPNRKGETPLFACCCGRPKKNINDNQMALYLLSDPLIINKANAGVHVNVNAVTKDGWTPLHAACANQNLVLVQRLLQCGANAAAAAASMTTPLHLACRSSSSSSSPSSSSSKSMICGRRRQRGRQPLHDYDDDDEDDTSSVQEEEEDEVTTNSMRLSILDAAAANARTKNHHETTNLQIMRALLQHGASVNATDDQGMTPLHYACQDATSLQVVLFLLQKGAHVNAVTTMAHGVRTPLHIACRGLKVLTLDLVKLLVQYGADLTARDSSGYLPLHVACDATCPDVVQFLVEQQQQQQLKGDPIPVVNTVLCCSSSSSGKNDGWTPLHFACRRRNAAMVRVLLKGEGSGTCNSSSSSGSVRAKTSLNVVCSNGGETPLHVACRRWAWDIVPMLLDHDATTIHVANARGQTPLHLVVATGNQAAVRLLLLHGADLEAKDDQGRTPFMMAHRNINVLNMLLREYNAIEQLRQSKGKTYDRNMHCMPAQSLV